MDISVQVSTQSELRCAWCHDVIKSKPRFCPQCHVALHGTCCRGLDKCPTLGCDSKTQDQVHSTLRHRPYERGEREQYADLESRIKLCLATNWLANAYCVELDSTLNMKQVLRQLSRRRPDSSDEKIRLLLGERPAIEIRPGFLPGKTLRPEVICDLQRNGIGTKIKMRVQHKSRLLGFYGRTLFLSLWLPTLVPALIFLSQWVQQSGNSGAVLSSVGLATHALYFASVVAFMPLLLMFAECRKTRREFRSYVPTILGRELLRIEPEGTQDSPLVVESAVSDQNLLDQNDFGIMQASNRGSFVKSQKVRTT